MDISYFIKASILMLTETTVYSAVCLLEMVTPSRKLWYAAEASLAVGSLPKKLRGHKKLILLFLNVLFCFVKFYKLL